MFETICDIDNIYEAYKRIRAASSWKEETQRYELYLGPNLFQLRDSIRDGSYRPTPPRGFFISERGKPRYIESRTVNDRVVQSLIHEEIILPAIRPKLIYDNAASLELRGTDFFRKRLEYHLTDFACHYGNDGYILLIDFKKFFDNIWHQTYIDMLRPLISDPRVMGLIEMLINFGAIDVSYMSDEEYANCMFTPFNNLEYRLAVASGQIKCTGEKFMRKGMGLGSQISQDAGVFVPHIIDNFIKIVCGIHWYGRYMDDCYICHPSKEYLWRLLGEITKIANSIGIFINEKKTQIVSLKHEFTILQTRYGLHPNHSITIMPNNDTFKREAAKLKKQADELAKRKISIEEIERQYKSWKGNIAKNVNGVYVPGVCKMDDLYNSLYIDPFIQGGY